MICPRCKGESPNNALTCTKCSLKLNTVCPRCKTLNKIGQASCVNCKLMLIRFCPKCKTPNFPTAKNCRKCDLALIKNSTPPKASVDIEQNKKFQENFNFSQDISNIKPDEVNKPSLSQEVKIVNHTSPPLNEPLQSINNNSPNVPKQENKSYKLLSRGDSYNQILKILKTSNQGLIIDLSANDGAGKSSLVSNLPQSLHEDNIVWLIGNCQPDQQFVPYSFFRDMLRTLFSLPLFVPNLDESINILKKIVEANLEIADANLEEVLERIIFSKFDNCSDDITENRIKIHNAVFQLVNILSKKSGVIMIIEDFEYIDSASLDCLKFIFSNGFLAKKNFVIINHNSQVNVHDSFQVESLKNKIYSISFKSLSFDELNSSMLGMLNGQDILPPLLKHRIFELSKDMPLYMEQVLWFLFQIGAVISRENALFFNPKAENIVLPTTLDELVLQRLQMLSNTSSEAIRVIMAACMLGVKFPPYFVQLMTQVEEAEFNQIAQMLVNNGVFVISDQFNIRFKHNYIWRVAYEQNFSEEDIINGAKVVLDIYSKYPGVSNNTLLVRHIEEAELKKESIQIYDFASKESVCYGDPATFTEYLNRLYELLPESDISEEQKLNFKIEIEEKLGRANYQYKPELAMEYLSNSIMYAEKQGLLVKAIDLSGYLTRSCELLGNFSGAIECCDKAISYLDKNKNDFEILLLNYYKLFSIFNMGRHEEVIVNANNEILPKLTKYISKNKPFAGMSNEELKIIEYEVELILLQAYAFQGNIKALELSEHIISRAQKDSQNDFELRALLVQSLFVIIQGNLKKCNSIIEKVNDKISSVKSPEKHKLFWYFVTILASFADGNLEQARELCTTGIKLATILNEYNILTLIKLIQGKIFEQFNNRSFAVNIYNEVVNYSSENKLALGALYSWYLVADTELKSGNIDRALEIAERAIEIAQKPNISNKLAEIMLRKIVSRARVSKNDYEGAQINIEIAINLAEQNNLYMWLALLYIDFAQIYRHGSATSNDPKNSLNVANRLLTKAHNFSQIVENDYISSIIENFLAELNDFSAKCGIKLESN